MKNRFDTTVAGLQIAWEDDQELEFLGAAVLAGKGLSTAARCSINGRTINYLYPMTPEKTGIRLTLKYETTPSNWPSSWEICKGILTIQFAGPDATEPETVTWLLEESGENRVLEKNKEWIYVPEPPPNSVEITVRGRKLVSVINRSGQQKLRNTLISDRAICQVTDAQCANVLEACHIVPVKNGGSDDLGNVLLLRRDLHALFDAGLLRFDIGQHDLRISLDAGVTDEGYQGLRSWKRPAKTFCLHLPYLHARSKLERRHSREQEGQALSFALSSDKS